MEDKKESERCGKANANNQLAETFWNDQYISNTTQWDMNMVSPPIKEYIDQLTNKDLQILIPGCGNAYEAQYLLQQGFTNIKVIDISPVLVARLQTKFNANPNIKIISGDFFKHNGNYDLVLEQTFFCAIEPILRQAYIAKMKEILLPGGKLVGILFGKEFNIAGPPFGGLKEDYQLLFEKEFIIKTMVPCHNSFYKRQGTELFIIMQKK